MRQLSFIIISVAIHPRHRHRHHHCRHHHYHHYHHHHHNHHHFLVYYPLVSSFLLSFRPPRRLVFLSMCECRISCSMFLEPCLGNCYCIGRCLTLVYRDLAWEPVLGSLAWEPVLGSLFLGTCTWEHCLIICSWELSLGNLFLETLPACFKPVHWDLAREPVLRNFAWEPCLGTCPSEACL